MASSQKSQLKPNMRGRRGSGELWSKNPKKVGQTIVGGERPPPLFPPLLPTVINLFAFFYAFLKRLRITVFYNLRTAPSARFFFALLFVNPPFTRRLTRTKPPPASRGLVTSHRSGQTFPWRSPFLRSELQILHQRLSRYVQVKCTHGRPMKRPGGGGGGWKEDCQGKTR